MVRVEAVISDFGGVLTTPLFAAFAAFQDEVGISPETLGKAMRAGLAEGEELPLYRLERGEISEDEFIVTRLGHSPLPADTRACIFVQRV